MNIKRTPKVRSDDEPPKKLTKLEIVAEAPESERYDFTTRINCLKCNIEIPKEAGNVAACKTEKLLIMVAPNDHSCPSFRSDTWTPV